MTSHAAANGTHGRDDKTSRRLFSVAILAWATAVVGCASFGAETVKPYQPLVVASSAPADARWTALTALAAHDGWTLLAARRDAGTIEAVRVIDPEWRDHILVTLRPNETVVDLRTEMRVGAGWMTTSHVCSAYDHNRERSIVSAAEMLPDRPSAPAGTILVGHAVPGAAAPR